MIGNPGGRVFGHTDEETDDKIFAVVEKSVGGAELEFATRTVFFE